jgi:ATP-binding cassette subfamily C protein
MIDRGQRPVWPAVGLGLLMIASALTEGLGLLLLVPMLGVLGAGQSGGGRISQFLTTLGIPLELGPLLLLFVALVLLRAAIGYCKALAAMRFEMTLVDGLRARAWRALLHADWRMLVTMQQSDNASLLITNIDRIGHGVNQAITALATLITLAGIGAAALAISPQISLTALAGGSLVLFAYRGMRRRAAMLGEQLGDAYGQVHGSLSEGLGALRVIKSFGREDRAEADGTLGFKALRQAQLTFLRDMGRGQIALQGGGAAVLAALVWLGITRWHITAAAILPLVALFARALPLLGALQESWQNWSHARPAMTATMDLIDRAEAAREPDEDGTPPPELTREIALDSVTVRFPGRPQAALDRITLTIPARQTTALIGASGAGKSTLADLIGGLIAPDAGGITIDGAALDGPVRRAWRRRVAYVQQEPVLFAGTIRDNLLWAEPGANEDRLHAALRDASAGFVLTLPQGLDTSVGDGGRQLSGGERQRIVLARALLRDPALLILDEATSALDAANEAAIAEALGRLRERLTIIIIGHRGALSVLADQIVTLKDGQIAEISKKLPSS